MNPENKNNENVPSIDDLNAMFEGEETRAMHELQNTLNAVVQAEERADAFWQMRNVDRSSPQGENLERAMRDAESAEVTRQYVNRTVGRGLLGQVADFFTGRKREQ